MTDHTDDAADDEAPEIAPGLSAPAYPQQPADAERPVPSRRMPDRTQDPSDWDVASTEPATPRGTDEVIADRRAVEESARRDGDERDDALRAGTDDESAYSTEIEQGAAQPRPDGP